MLYATTEKHVRRPVVSYHGSLDPEESRSALQGVADELRHF